MNTSHRFLAIWVLAGLLQASCNKDTPAINNPSESHLIKITANGEIPVDEFTDIVLEEVSGDSTNAYAGKIKRRGGYSISFPKHSYEVDLKNDASIAGLPSDDDWILNANFIDKTFMRHTFSYDLFRALDPDINIAPLYRYSELELNGQYNGLYVLMEKMDKSSLHINENDTSGVIFKEPPLFRASLDSYVPQYADNYHQQTYPEIGDFDKSPVIAALRSFIINSNDSVFVADVGRFFDLDNIIDWHLLLLLSNNSDGILKNFYLYKKDAQTPFRIAPWDYDHSFGRDGDNELNLIRPLDINRSNLLSRLLTFDWYKSALKQRWMVLNEQGFFSVAGLKGRIAALKKILDPLVIKNFEHWPVNHPIYYDANDYEAEIEIILRFIDMRHQQLSEYFDTL